MTQVAAEIAVYIAATGELSYLAPAHLKANDPALAWVALPAGYDSETWAWSPTAKGMVEDLGRVKARLLAQIDADREAREMAVLTAGGAKKYVYNRKAEEAIDARSLLSTALNALSLTDKERRYPFATAEMQLTGESLSTVISRFEAGMAASTAKIAVIDAKATIAKRAVRAATTKSAVLQAATVTW